MRPVWKDEGLREGVDRCTSMRVYPRLYTVQCTREKGHTGEHVNGPEAWSTPVVEQGPMARRDPNRAHIRRTPEEEAADD